MEKLVLISLPKDQPKVKGFGIAGRGSRKGVYNVTLISQSVRVEQKSVITQWTPSFYSWGNIVIGTHSIPCGIQKLSLVCWPFPLSYLASCALSVYWVLRWQENSDYLVTRSNLSSSKDIWKQSQKRIFHVLYKCRRSTLSHGLLFWLQNSNQCSD